MNAMALAGIAVLLASSPGAHAQDLARRAGAVAEAYGNVEVAYTAATGPKGRKVRVITTRPAGAGRYPTVFLAGWLSCDTLEAPAGDEGAASHIFRAIAKTPGIAMVRMDKQGVGDSEGECSTTDFNDELGAYRAAFAKMQTMPFVDPNRIIILGISNGGGFAPLIAQGSPVAGYISIGGWSRTWFEHMLDIERARRWLEGKKPAEVAELVSKSARLYHDVLLKGGQPADLIAAVPQLREAWDSEDTKSLYGRPVAFYQQLQGLNLAEAWSKVSAPTLVLWGEYDWIMSRHDAQGIADLVNANTPGAARFVEVTGAGHSLDAYRDLKASFSGRPDPFNPATAKLITDWLGAHAG